ncbi:MAG: hypothetical protein JWR07_1903 [Nevskia sp.]|nr:hypothetical protein [Nevskia sp.]
MKPIPLFGDGVKSYSEAVTAQRRLNVFFDVRTDGDKEKIVVRGTPGTVLWITLPVFPIRAWRVVKGVMYALAGANLYSVTSAGVVTTLGSITNGSSLCSMSDNGLQVILVDGIAGYIYAIGGAFTTIVDANFPAGASTVGFLNGRFYVESPNTLRFYLSGSYDGTLWTPVAFASKENNPDNIVAVDVLNGMLILYGGDTTEFWQDNGVANVPVQRIGGTTQTWGLAAKFSRANLNNTQAFLGKNPQGSVQVLMLDGYKPVRISTSDIENIINGFSTFSDAVALTYMIDGHPMYQLTFPTGGRSFLFDAVTHMWFEVQTGLGLMARHYGNLGIVFGAVNYMADYSSGNIYQISGTVYTDNLQPIKRQVVSRHVSNGGNRFSIDKIFLDMETGVGLQSGQGSTPMISMEVSKDKGRTFSAPLSVSLGAVGQYESPRPIWRRIGAAIDFVFRFTVTDPVKFVITSGSAKTRSQEGSDG